MSVSPEAVAMRFDEHSFWATWNTVELSRSGLYGNELDKDISIVGLIAGRSDVTKPPTQAA